METDHRSLAFAYLRLSREEAMSGESSSIKNQRQIIRNYCTQNHYVLVREFIDDGWSGGNFNRPGFQAMLAELGKRKANTVITKDLSRLGRDMRESSYYAEEYFPEHGIRYIALADNFDTEHENIMAPFQFAMNEVYLRDGSRKVKDVLRSKRENGQYCACPPFGYRKDPHNRNLLVPDEVTAPIVRRIFSAAAAGDSSHKIAADLNRGHVIPPLKYRILYRDTFSEEGAAHASDLWNHTTVKRILKNQVYLGHTILGKSKKVSVKSKKKVAVPQGQWAITQNTHEPLISGEVFDRAQRNLARNSTSYRDCKDARRSIFAGMVFCGRCGHALCSGGGVYKGERNKYWKLYCTQQRKDAKVPCKGVNIRYADLLEVVRQELNALLSLTDEEIEELVQAVYQRYGSSEHLQRKKKQAQKARARLTTIDRMITKLYTDNAEGRLPDERLTSMVNSLEEESVGLRGLIAEAEESNEAEMKAESYNRFFELARRYTKIETLDRDILQTFIDRIEVGPKILPEGFSRPPRKNAAYQQSIRIFYRFIGELEESLPDTSEEQESTQNGKIFHRLA